MHSTLPFCVAVVVAAVVVTVASATTVTSRQCAGATLPDVPWALDVDEQNTVAARLLAAGPWLRPRTTTAGDDNNGRPGDDNGDGGDDNVDDDPTSFAAFDVHVGLCTSPPACRVGNDPPSFVCTVDADGAVEHIGGEPLSIVAIVNDDDDDGALPTTTTTTTPTPTIDGAVRGVRLTLPPAPSSSSTSNITVDLVCSGDNTSGPVDDANASGNGMLVHADRVVDAHAGQHIVVATAAVCELASYYASEVVRSRLALSSLAGGAPTGANTPADGAAVVVTDPAAHREYGARAWQATPTAVGTTASTALELRRTRDRRSKAAMASLDRNDPRLLLSVGVDVRATPALGSHQHTTAGGTPLSANGVAACFVKSTPSPLTSSTCAATATATSSTGCVAEYVAGTLHDPTSLSGFRNAHWRCIADIDDALAQTSATTLFGANVSAANLACAHLPAVNSTRRSLAVLSAPLSHACASQSIFVLPERIDANLTLQPGTIVLVNGTVTVGAGAQLRALSGVHIVFDTSAGSSSTLIVDGRILFSGAGHNDQFVLLEASTLPSAPSEQRRRRESENHDAGGDVHARARVVYRGVPTEYTHFNTLSGTSSIVARTHMRGVAFVCDGTCPHFLHSSFDARLPEHSHTPDERANAATVPALTLQKINSTTPKVVLGSCTFHSSPAVHIAGSAASDDVAAADDDNGYTLSVIDTHMNFDDDDDDDDDDQDDGSDSSSTPPTTLGVCVYGSDTRFRRFELLNSTLAGTLELEGDKCAENPPLSPSPTLDSYRGLAATLDNATVWGVARGSFSKLSVERSLLAQGLLGIGLLTTQLNSDNQLSLCLPGTWSLANSELRGHSSVNNALDTLELDTCTVRGTLTLPHVTKVREARVTASRFLPTSTTSTTTSTAAPTTTPPPTSAQLRDALWSARLAHFLDNATLADELDAPIAMLTLAARGIAGRVTGTATSHSADALPTFVVERSTFVAPGDMPALLYVANGAADSAVRQSTFMLPRAYGAAVALECPSATMRAPSITDNEFTTFDPDLLANGDADGDGDGAAANVDAPPSTAARTAAAARLHDLSLLLAFVADRDDTSDYSMEQRLRQRQQPWLQRCSACVVDPARCARLGADGISVSFARNRFPPLDVMLNATLASQLGGDASSSAAAAAAFHTARVRRHTTDFSHNVRWPRVDLCPFTLASLDVRPAAGVAGPATSPADDDVAACDAVVPADFGDRLGTGGYIADGASMHLGASPDSTTSGSATVHRLYSSLVVGATSTLLVDGARTVVEAATASSVWLSSVRGAPMFPLQLVVLGTLQANGSLASSLSSSPPSSSSSSPTAADRVRFRMHSDSGAVSDGAPLGIGGSLLDNDVHEHFGGVVLVPDGTAAATTTLDNAEVQYAPLVVDARSAFATVDDTTSAPAARTTLFALRNVTLGHAPPDYSDTVDAGGRVALRVMNAPPASNVVIDALTAINGSVVVEFAPELATRLSAAVPSSVATAADAAAAWSVDVRVGTESAFDAMHVRAPDALPAWFGVSLRAHSVRIERTLVVENVHNATFEQTGVGVAADTSYVDFDPARATPSLHIAVRCPASLSADGTGALAHLPSDDAASAWLQPVTPPPRACGNVAFAFSRMQNVNVRAAEQLTLYHCGVQAHGPVNLHAYVGVFVLLTTVTNGIDDALRLAQPPLFVAPPAESRVLIANCTLGVGVVSEFMPPAAHVHVAYNTFPVPLSSVNASATGEPQPSPSQHSWSDAAVFVDWQKTQGVHPHGPSVRIIGNEVQADMALLSLRLGAAMTPNSDQSLRDVCRSSPLPAGDVEAPIAVHVEHNKVDRSSTTLGVGRMQLCCCDDAPLLAANHSWHNTQVVVRQNHFRSALRPVPSSPTPAVGALYVGGIGVTLTDNLFDAYRVDADADADADSDAWLADSAAALVELQPLGNDANVSAFVAAPVHLVLGEGNIFRGDFARSPSTWLTADDASEPRLRALALSVPAHALPDDVLERRRRRRRRRKRYAEDDENHTTTPGSAPLAIVDVRHNRFASAVDGEDMHCGADIVAALRNAASATTTTFVQSGLVAPLLAASVQVTPCDAGFAGWSLPTATATLPVPTSATLPPTLMPTTTLPDGATTTTTPTDVDSSTTTTTSTDTSTTTTTTMPSTTTTTTTTTTMPPTMTTTTAAANTVSTLPTQTELPTATELPSGGDDDDDESTSDEQQKNKHTFTVVAAVVGTLALAAVLVSFVVLLLRWKRRDKRAKLLGNNYDASASYEANTNDVNQAVLDMSDEFDVSTDVVAANDSRLRI